MLTTELQHKDTLVKSKSNQSKSKQFNSGNVAHTTNMRDYKRQTDTVTNMTVENITAHKHSKIYSRQRTDIKHYNRSLTQAYDDICKTIGFLSQLTSLSIKQIVDKAKNLVSSYPIQMTWRMHWSLS